MSGSLPINWPIPDPATLASQAAGVFETNFAGIDARSANSVAATYCRVTAMTAYDLYLMQGNLAQELMVNTAVAWLPYHANIWSVPQLQPVAATGNVLVSGAPTTVIAAGTLMSFGPLGWQYMTTASVTIGSGGTASLPIISALAGSAYNLPSGTVLGLVSPISGLSPQSATVDSNGVANGADLENIDAWRARIIAKIGQPGNGGSPQDYFAWAQAAGAPCVNVVPGAVGAGSVGIYIAAAGPAVASGSLVTAVQTSIGVYNSNAGLRPATARALVMAADLPAVNIELHLNPDTALTRAAAISAIELFFAQSAQQLYQQFPAQPQANTLFLSRLNGAISNGDGEYSHELYQPTADLNYLPSQMFVLGAVNFL